MLEPSSIADVTGALLSVTVKNALNTFLTELTSKASKAAQSGLERITRDVFLGFSNYLEASYNKCRQFKSVLNPAQPLDTLEKYVHISLQYGNKYLSDDTFTSSLIEGSRVIVSGWLAVAKACLCDMRQSANLKIQVMVFHFLLNYVG